MVQNALGGMVHPAVTKPVLPTAPDEQESAATHPLTLGWDGKGESGPKVLLYSCNSLCQVGIFLFVPFDVFYVP